MSPALRCAELEMTRLEAQFGIGLSADAVLDAEPLPDSTTKAVVRDARGRPVAFATCSSAVRPDVVARSLENAAGAKAILGPELGMPVIVPLAHGVLDGLSYALFAYHPPFPQSGLRWRVLRGGLARSVLGWLLAVAEACRRASGDVDASGEFGRALEAVRAHERLPKAMRSCAERALLRLSSGRWTPAHVIDHNDCWSGNLLRPRRDARHRSRQFSFVLIDWAGANLRGFGVYDCVRMAQSARVGAESLARWLSSYAKVSACDPSDLAGHLLASIGHLGMNLGFFSEERFAAGANESWELFSAATRSKA